MITISYNSQSLLFYLSKWVLLVSLEKYHSSSVFTIEEGSFDHFQSVENTIEQILQKEKSAASVLCHIKLRLPTLATSIELAKDVVGIVATLGKLGEYIGLDTMMAIVCKTLKGVKALETYDKEGRINKSTGLYMLESSIRRHMDGRYVVSFEQVDIGVGDTILILLGQVDISINAARSCQSPGPVPMPVPVPVPVPVPPPGTSAILGFFATVCRLPFNYVKTQIQKMQPDATGKYRYKYSLDCAMKTLKAGGPFKFYTGFLVYCIRIAPHVMFIEEAELSLHDAFMIIRKALKKRLSLQDEFDDSEFSNPFTIDDDDLMDPCLSIVAQGITVETSLKNCKASMKFTLVGESWMSALTRSQSPNQLILSRCIDYWYDGDSTIGYKLYKEITKVEFVKMKGKGRLTQPTKSYQCIIVTEVESFK
ncbi:hypothetical protein GIB67_030099 [Kingdonia uniflora]|uniref:Uncharacterized protein n=1 Tax=Kingdonia uniflora TaxID=39325 RepID=A0A7J7L2P0_9MAGN|nr:hypothetical protein GIB67_030099 [Kingdonia uniflora]